MPDITLNLKVADAIAVFNRVGGLTHGDKTFKAPRQKFIRSISNAWPELENAERTKAETDAMLAAKPRPIVFTSDQQKAVSEGLLALACKQDTSDLEVFKIFKDAKILRISGRLDREFMADSCGPMTEALDGENDDPDGDESNNFGGSEVA